MTLDWESVPADPDLHDDLGYELQPLTVLEAETTDDQYVFLPQEADHEEANEFIIAEEEAVLTVLDMW